MRLVILCGLMFFCSSLAMAQDGAALLEEGYIAVGDSYTFCEGADPAHAWPVLLARHLSLNGIPITLQDNLARNGWSTEEVIRYALPIFERAKPTFATLLIGVNDWVREADAPEFRQRFKILLDRMLKVLPGKGSLLVITIPDFSVTPEGSNYSGGRDISAGIAEFNRIIKEETQNAGVTVVDIYSVSKEMGKDPALVAADGLHPSAKEYAVWESLIYPVAAEKLANKK